MTQEIMLNIAKEMQIEYPGMYLGASRPRKEKTAMIPPIFPNYSTCQPSVDHNLVCDDLLQLAMHCLQPDDDDRPGSC